MRENSVENSREILSRAHPTWIISRDLGFKFNLILVFLEIICHKPVAAHPDTEFCRTKASLWWIGFN